ncbi:MAG: hypothetical protein ACREX8_06300 [Gammaproteobacteria bacterium]
MWAMLVVLAMAMSGATSYGVEMVTVGIPISFACTVADAIGVHPRTLCRT